MDLPEGDRSRDDTPHASRAQVTFGLIVALVGIVMLADSPDWWGFHMNVPFWPFFLIFLGFSKIANRRPGINRSGAWLMFIGVWGLVNEYRFMGLRYVHTWPILVIGAGALMIWQALDPSPKRPVSAPPTTLS
jgi:hypothetical protein